MSASGTWVYCGNCKERIFAFDHNCKPAATGSGEPQHETSTVQPFMTAADKWVRTIKDEAYHKAVYMLAQELERLAVPTPPASQPTVTADWLAEKFHETYERLAPKFSYETRKESAVPWRDVPARNKLLMIAVAEELLALLRAAEQK